jgi:crotonobetainyl-CoA:carnitine CoA-transferase CaiB-like acyl-CoA transferase
MATQILGDLGADVLKIERPEGEWSRHWGVGNGRTHGELDTFLAFNRNKRSIALDLKSEEGRARALAMAAEADVVVENFRPGVMDRLGLGYEVLRELNPGLVYACSSGWGQTGPYVGRPGQDLLAQAMSGLLTMNGQDGEPPMGVGVGVADLYTGMHIVVGVLAALVHRAATGVGQRIEVDLFSCITALQQQEFTYYLSHGALPERPTRNMVSRFATAPFGIYGTADGHLVLAMNPCTVLAEALELPELAPFDTNELMLEHRDEIHDAIVVRLRDASTQHWIERMLEFDIWCAPVQDYDDLVHDPQLAENALLWDVPVGVGDDVFRTVGSPIRMSATPPRIRRGVPRVGQHTAEAQDGWGVANGQR